MLGIPPQIEQAILQQAQQQGMTVNQLLTDLLTTQAVNPAEMSLNSETTHFLAIRQEEYQHLMRVLDDETPPTDALKALLNS